ncbi:hypothetical protein [Sulfurospirillum multivorans]|uniref:Integral membrane protein n=2 Tax=Sulfurospirillum multivorans TaxID=66821 RepID=A0AA86DXP6_SULMK|nr:hypothetical protein [Sulfurospirillum multivorans]AHJ12278.1 integral membrane protein [Sulfurospirillum multivorans DSM 12446]QEH05778.1 integral membrane protein [Sulfurospirillum multivorans]
MNTICKMALLVITLLHVTQLFMPVSLELLTFFTALLFVLGLFIQKSGFRTITLFFFTLGTLILIYYKLPFSIGMQSLTSMTNIIAIIVVMQLFSIPIEVGHYSDTVEYWLKRLFKKESSLYLFAMLVTNLFASFLLFGTVPVMVSLFNKALKNSVSQYQRFFATAIMRGYTLALFWAPGAIIILLVMQVTHVSWSQLFVPGLLLSLIGMLTSYALEHFTRLNKPIISMSETLPATSSIAKNAPKQTAHIILVIISLIVGIGLLERFSIATGTGRILLAGLIVSTIWITYYRNQPELKTVLKNYGESGIMQATDFSVFFIAVGLFAGAVDHSGILSYIQPLLQESVNHLGIFSILVIPLLFILIALCGIHPLVLAVMFGKILLSVSLPLSSVSIALILLISAAVSFIISPFAGMSLMTAKFLHVTPLEVSLKWNLLFCSLFLVEGLVFAYLWQG